MSYATKMQLRMLVPCLAPLAFTLLIAWAASVIEGLPEKLGGHLAGSMLPDYILLAGLSLTSLLTIVQGIRVWRWSRGEGDLCYVCGCLLGFEKLGRRGVYRPCLGCNASHPVD